MNQWNPNLLKKRVARRQQVFHKPELESFDYKGEKNINEQRSK